MKVGEPFNPYRLFHGIHIPEAVVQFRGLSPGAKLVWGRLGRYRGNSDRCNPLMADLALEVGLSERQVREYVHELESQAFVAIERRGQGLTNSYQFLWHQCFDGDKGSVRINDSENFSDRKDAADLDRNQSDRKDAADQDRKDAADQDRKDAADPLRVVVLESLTESPLGPPPTPAPQTQHQEPPTLSLQHNPEEGTQQERAGVAGLKPPFRQMKRYREKPRALGLATKLQEQMAATEAETGLGLNGNSKAVVSGQNVSPIDPGAPQRFVALWNRIVPKAAVKWHASFSQYPAFRDPEFGEVEMEQICHKAKDLYDSDEFYSYLTFKGILGFDRQTGVLAWPGVLQLKPKTKKGTGDSAVAELIRKRREARGELNATK